MKYSLLASLFGILLILGACGHAVSQKSKNKDKGKEYSEDLSPFRLQYEVVKDTTGKVPVKTDVKPTNDITAQLNKKLDTIAVRNQKFHTMQGYRILVYSGGSSEEARKIKGQVYDVLPNENIYTTYHQPSFRVKVGDYQDRIEANYILSTLSKSFPNAMIVPDQINIKPNR